jgi:hypothetical protein
LCGGALTLPDKNRCFEVNSASLAKKIGVGGLQNAGGGVYNTCNTLHADVAFPTSFSIVRLAFLPISFLLTTCESAEDVRWMPGTPIAEDVENTGKTG